MANICMHQLKYRLQIDLCKITVHFNKKNMMSISLRIGFILLGFICCVHLQEKCSSFFSFSSLATQREDSESIADLIVNTELACALRCSSMGNCNEATFCRESKKCSLRHKKTEGVADSQTAGGQMIRSGIVRMVKVGNILRVMYMWSLDILKQGSNGELKQTTTARETGKSRYQVS